MLLGLQGLSEPKGRHPTPVGVAHTGALNSKSAFLTEIMLLTDSYISSSVVSGRFMLASQPTGSVTEHLLTS